MAIQNFRVGGFATDDPDDFIQLSATFDDSADVSTFRKAGASAGYQITSNLKFYICKIAITSTSGNASDDAIALGFADNDVGISTTTARTNPVDVIGEPENTTIGTIGGFGYNASITGLLAEANNAGNPLCFLAIPANATGKFLYGKYIGASVNNPSMHITGFEL